MALECGNQNGQERLQSLAADTIGRFPEDDQCLPKCFVEEVAKREQDRKRRDVEDDLNGSHDYSGRLRFKASGGPDAMQGQVWVHLKN